MPKELLEIPAGDRVPLLTMHSGLDYLLTFAYRGVEATWYDIRQHCQPKDLIMTQKQAVRDVLHANKAHQQALKAYAERLEAELQNADKLIVSNIVYFLSRAFTRVGMLVRRRIPRSRQ